MEPLPAPSAKRSWPLLVLGACAFVPGFGIFFGAAAVTWGLVSDRPRAKWGVLLGGAGALSRTHGQIPRHSPAAGRPADSPPAAQHLRPDGGHLRVPSRIRVSPGAGREQLRSLRARTRRQAGHR